MSHPNEQQRDADIKQIATVLQLGKATSFFEVFEKIKTLYNLDTRIVIEMSGPIQIVADMENIIRQWNKTNDRLDRQKADLIKRLKKILPPHKDYYDHDSQGNTD